jgi:hypothetical protein
MRFEFAAATLATAVLGSPLTHAADVNQDALSPQQRLHQAQADMRQVAQKGQSGMYKLDIEPPQLTSFAAATSINLNKLNQNTLTVNLGLSDNVVGVSRVDIQAQPLSGNWGYANGSISTSFPVKRTTASVNLNFWSNAEAGPWQITSVNVYDANNNVRSYNAAALAVLGNNQFTVINPNASESVPPTLNAGKILTPVVSRAAPPRGEYPYNAARVGLELSVTDEGSPKPSGLGAAYATLCLPDGWTCLYAYGNSMTPGAKSGKVLLGAQASGYTSAGVYRMQYLQLQDAQGNAIYLDQGSTDFDALFGGDASVTITE